MTKSSSGQFPGLFLWLERKSLAQLSISLRFYNELTAKTGGTQLPVVRERDLTNSTVQLTGLPVSEPDTRVTLRIYDFDSPQHEQVMVRYYDECSQASIPIAETIVSLENNATSRQHLPTQISIDVFQSVQIAPATSLRIEVVPWSGNGRLWAFASVNSNDGRVSVFFPN